MPPRRTTGATASTPRRTTSRGHLEIEKTRPVAPDSIFRIYSMTKPIVSVGLMMLWEQGRFQLDDPVSKFVPSWKDQRVFVGGNHPNWKTTPVERPMNVRDLLSHQSGLTYGFMERTNVDAAYRTLGVGDLTRAGYTARDMVEELGTLPLEFSPGTRWNYSVSTDVCGHLIELISGQRLDAYLKEHVLQPLGMTDTSFVVADDRTKRFAANYQRQRDDRLTLIDDPAKSAYRERAFFSGGVGLVSTAHDYFRFASMMLNQGELDGIRLLGRKTVELMTMNHLPDGQDLTNLAFPGMYSETAYYGVGFGLGFSVMQSPARAMIAGTPGEFAWVGAAGTAFWIDPGEQMIVVFMTQIMQMGLPAPYPLRRELRTLAYSSVIE